MRPFLPFKILFLNIISFKVQVSVKKPIGPQWTPHGLMGKFKVFLVSFRKYRQNVPVFLCDLYQFNTAIFEINGGMLECEQHTDGKWETTTAAHAHAHAHTPGTRHPVLEKVPDLIIIFMHSFIHMGGNTFASSLLDL